ncbi:BadF/BadG/BcrA/BcrD ATPase family protein [Nocardioides sp. YIM 152315]|uniref:N-acetylglucosamine kinase n=1 Tax=Nocardioides sp. YIM 152315 TaxID=3031760 RepID=UPI0023DB603C|nr:BadF/BadG/BcrA/BcrD ATPase family protein [Nocardioides sp. YIM 152315]MDF1602662.1 BadF/BadG/BcrA/BcrD ATPase family protein [Nocardioides sp. YIM 152315]
MFLAVDAGGSSTRAVVVEPSGRCVGLGVAGGGNPRSSGPDRVVVALADAVRRALSTAEVTPASIGGVVVAMAGSRSLGPDAEDAVIGEGLAAAGVQAPVAMESDILAMFHTGSWAADGYVLVAGTGAAAIRVRAGRVDAVSDGMGWLLGDDGSGFWIGHRVARAAAADLDGRGPATALTALVLAQLGVDPDGSGRSALHRMVDVVYDLRPVELSRLAPLAFTVDDEVAAAIVDGATAALVHTLDTVVDDRVAGPLVLGGSVLLHQRVVAARVEDSFRRRGGAGSVARVVDGVAGGAALVLRHGGVDVDAAVFARIGESLASLRPQDA